MSKSQPLPQPSRIAVPRVHGSLWLRGLVADLLVLIALGVLIVCGTLLSYRQPLHYRLPIVDDVAVPTVGLGRPEQGPSGWHRWTAPTMRLTLPHAGQAAYRIDLALHNSVLDAPRTLTVWAGQQQLGRYELRPNWQTVAVAVPAAAIDAPSGDLELQFTVDPPLRAGERELGVALRALTVDQVDRGWAPRNVQAALGLLALLIVVPLRVLGASRRLVGLGVAALCLLLLGALTWSRMGVIVSVPTITRVVAISCAAVPLLWLWIRAQGVAVRPWATAVAAVALALFVVRLAGMLHPEFVQIDHRLRVHQIEAIAGGARAQVQAELSNQYEWGDDLVVPYSLLSYDLFVPLVGWLSTGQLARTVMGVTAALDASVVLLLWSIARVNGSDARSSWWSAALFAAMPIGYLYFHDGSYPTIIGLWCTVVALWLLSLLAARPRPWLLAISSGMIAVSILMYVTHLAFVPALLGLTIGSAWLFGTPPIRRSVPWIALSAVLGFGIALLGYYGRALPTLLTTTLPAYVASIGSGGSVGRDASLLPGALLGTTWQQLWGHYRVIGVVLAAVGTGLLWRNRERWLTHVVLAYGIFLILTALADLRFGLWNKHMYFALPGVCLAAGPALGYLQQRGRVANASVIALFGYLVWTSLDAWLLRVIWYVWSLQTL